MVIGIALSAAERARLAQHVSSPAALLLVSTADEALAYLDNQQTEQRDGGDPSGGDAADQSGLRIDVDRHLLVWRDHEVAVTPLERQLMACLLARPGKVWSFAHLHEEVWGTRHLGAGSDVHSVVKRLRRKLAWLGCPVEIQALRGVGFRLVGEEHATPRSGPLPAPRTD